MHWVSKKFKPAIQGMIQMFSDPSIRLQILIAFCVIIFGFIYSFTLIEWMWILGCIFLVLICEIFNTAIEKLCDLIDLNENPKIKLIKDLCAAAVLLSASLSVIIGILILKGVLR